MTLPADLGALRCQLSEEIERAISTSEHIGESLVLCHLQMAQDLLAQRMAASNGRSVGGAAGPSEG